MASREDDVMVGEVAPGLAVSALMLARRFAAGGTLWCWAPGAREHAQHVAVEFVHPVVVGTRALPAVALLDDDPTDALRSMARCGDVLLAIAAADPVVGRLLGRGTAWGLSTVWLGAGPPPVAGAAEHVLWMSEDAAALRDGRLVLGYHLLWELTHVCFEHPGLLSPEPESGEVCTTCSDEGRLGEVVDIFPDAAEVRTAAGSEIVSTALVGAVLVGDLVLVHAGTAITVVPA